MLRQFFLSHGLDRYAKRPALATHPANRIPLACRQLSNFEYSTCDYLVISRDKSTNMLSKPKVSVAVIDCCV